MHKLTVMCAIFATVAAVMDENIIIEYCKSKTVSMGTMFSCSNKKQDIAVIKTLSKNGLRFLQVDIKQIFEISKYLERKYYNLVVVLDGTCPFPTVLLENKKFFYETYHWLIVNTKNEISVWENAPLNINSDVNVAVLDNKTENWTIFDVYNPASSHCGPFTVTKLGYYNRKDGYKAKMEGNRYWVRRNMTGVHFKSAVVVPDSETDLNEYLTSEASRQKNSMHRFQSVTVRYCKEFFNFSLEVQRTSSWGYMTPSGHFDGLVGLLERRIVDFGSSPLIYKLDRMPVVDYSYGNWILRSTFIYRRPKIVQASYQIFLRPLSTTVWICIGLMMALLMAFLKLVFSREVRILAERNRLDSSWSFLFLFTLGAFCQQGATCYPQLLSSRTLSVFVFLFCILIYQFYSASIVSYLLMDPPRKINNLRDLTDSSLEAGIEDILIDRNYFVQTTDPAAIELYNKKIKGGNNVSGFYEPGVGLEKVKRGGFAFHVETSTAYPIIEHTFTNQEICELEEVQMYRTQPMHTNLQKNSPFREMMNYFMLHVVETGIMYRLRKYWDARKPICIESAKKIHIHVGLAEFSSGLIVLSYGVCFSLIMVGFEVAVHNRHIWIDRVFKKRIIKPFVN